MKKASPAVCNTCGAGVCLHVSRAEDGYLSRIRELESRANAREVEVRAHMEARFAAEAECARLHQALDAAHAEASDCGNSENDEACGECRECWHVTKESMCRRISRAEMARDARTQDIAALRAENERLRKLLRRFEWQRDEGGYVMCPECDQTKGTPHLNDCRLGAALAAPQEEK